MYHQQQLQVFLKNAASAETAGAFFASEEDIDRATGEHVDSSGNISIDIGARCSPACEGTWVEAWFFLSSAADGAEQAVDDGDSDPACVAEAKADVDRVLAAMPLPTGDDFYARQLASFRDIVAQAAPDSSFFATEAEIARAKRAFGSLETEFDKDARVSRTDDGFHVQGWVWLAEPEAAEEEGAGEAIAA